ncbi:MAG: hypothetical protein ABIR55_23755 [Burkholderiaceae bacterium]
MPRTFQLIAHALRIRQHDSRFGDGLHHAHDLGFLVAQLAQTRHGCGGEAGLAFDLARNDQHWHRVGPCTEHPVHGVDATGAGGHIHNTNPSGNPCVALGRHCTSLLMVMENGTDLGMKTNRIVEEHRAAAGQHEDMPHPVFGEEAGDVFGDTDSGW